jgi:DNA-binding MarR family transcriptional regulator
MITTVRRRARATAGPTARGDGAGATVGLGMLAELIGYHVRLAQMAVFADFERALGALSLSPGLFGLLVIVEANPGLRQTQLADAARLDRSTLVPALDKLESRDLVERRAAPDDRRSNGLFLTAQGATLLAQAKRAVRAHEKRIAAELGEGDRATLIELLDRLAPGGRRP